MNFVVQFKFETSNSGLHFKTKVRAYKTYSSSVYKDVSASRKSRNPLATELEIRGFSSPDAGPTTPLTTTLGASFNPAAAIIATTCLFSTVLIIALTMG